MDILHLKNVSKQFCHLKATVCLLNSVNYSFQQGNTYAVVGVSGCGKSTLLHMIAGLDIPTDGSVLYNYQEYGTIPRKILARHISFVFQTPYLLKELSVIENVMLRGIALGYTKNELEDEAYSLLSEMGLKDKCGSPIVALSGGEQQRVALARALCVRPSFLLADEPTAHLDAYNCDLLKELLQKNCLYYGIGLIVSSHDRFLIESMNTILQISHQQLHIQSTSQQNNINSNNDNSLIQTTIL